MNKCRTLQRILVVLVAVAALAATSVLADDYYVAMPAPDGIGDDGNPGTSAAPFATIGVAIAAAGANAATIHVADGTYQEHSLTLAGPITIVGESGNRDAVIVDANKEGRAFTLNHASATLSGITVRNGKVTGDVNGGNICINSAGGTVTNCVIASGQITGGTDTTDPPKYGGANIYLASASALVVDCIVTGGFHSARWPCGGNIFATNGRVSHCLVAYGKQDNVNSGWPAYGANAALKGSAIMDNCLVKGGYMIGTRDNYDKGTGVSVDDNGLIVNCTIVGNSSKSQTAGAVGFAKNSSNARAVNCVIYGNGGTPTTEWKSANASRYYNCAFSSFAGFSGGTSCVVDLTDGAFRNYAEGDYTPAPGGGLIDAGVDTASYGVTADKDFAGNPRKSPAEGTIDIGCLEFDQESGELSVGFEYSKHSEFNGVAVTFTPAVYGATGEVIYKWDFDDGVAPITTGESSYSYAFTKAGLHYVTLSVSQDGGSSWTSFTHDTPVHTAPHEMWVDESCATPVNPYTTATTAIRSLAEAIGLLTNTLSQGATVLGGVKIHVKPGVYVGSNPKIATDVAIVGEGDRESIIVDAQLAGRAFYLNHASALISGITVRNGKVTGNVNGGNICIAAAGGTVTNCIVASGQITGGTDTTDPPVYGGANIYLGSASALVVDCIVTGGFHSAKWPCGGNIFATNGRVSRCLVAYGKLNTNNSNSPAYGANASLKGSAIMDNCLVKGGYLIGTRSNYDKGTGVVADGDGRIVNCTIVGNSSSGQTAGAVGFAKDSSNARAVNCVIYGNGGTPTTEWKSANAGRYYNCAFSAAAGFSGGTSCIMNLTDAAFKDFANGDYRPKSDGALFNAGSNGLYSAHATSATDLYGVQRIQSKIIDIGCYEASSSAGLQIIVR